ncbi:MAG: endonuclease V [Elusimicrobia bacterium]|jgi:deoxyribonuclease V|nr:endonuclease V [Elusimicrobiota bacterium]MBK7208017.1 endonuclease V [Elusimicrobiota bacterium]MBK7544795.1 endonuclease V [Elusimicrobiota bacterium]MBK7574307.1 endonuclease V [Elusimicrobiota bacterium]MBK7688329.1 endonuclease V [Elusimicrobiota bacterium]
MDIRNLHPWNIPASQAIGVQADLVRRLSLHNDFDDIGIIAGADVAMDPRTGMGFGAVVLLAYPSLEPVEVAVSKRKIEFPYVPGLLSFREGPVLLEAFERLDKEPDLIFFDGNGVAHPRGLGLASHLGLVLDKPTIGVAKTKLLGNHKAPGRKEGDSAELIYKGKMVGHAVRTKPATAPVFVSPGHKIDYETALRLTLTCVDGARVPKPTRLADAVAAAAKKGKEKEAIKKLK